MARAWPPGMLPQPRFRDPGVCTPGAALISSAAALRSQAASAIQSWCLRARAGGQHTNPVLPLRQMIYNWGIARKEGQPTRLRPPALLSARLSLDPGAQGMVACLYPDTSVALLVSCGSDHSDRAPYRFLPMPLMLAPGLSAHLGPKRTLRVGVIAGTYTLHYAHGGTTQALSGRDPVHMPTEAKALYAGIIAHAAAWVRALEDAGDVAIHAPPGRDWGVAEGQPWYVPPCLPHRWFSQDQHDALTRHLEHAVVLIGARMLDTCSGFNLAITAGQRRHNGAMAPLAITAKAISNQTHRIDAQAQRTIVALARKALAHPASPLSPSQLVATALFVAKNPKKPPYLAPLPLFFAHRNAADPAHRRLAAIAALGQAWMDNRP